LSTKKNILIFVDWFLPGKNAGGPIRSVANIIRKFDSEFNFKVVTSAFDLGAKDPYDGVLQDQWTDFDGINVWYASSPPDAELIQFFIDDAVDVIYMNSLFSRSYTQLPLKVIKKVGFKGTVVLAPRGMLFSGALQIKAFKKKVFLRAAKIFKWYDRVIWHASTEQEKAEIRLHFGSKTDVLVAENLAFLPDYNVHEKPKKECGHAEFVFVSRISINKNLLHWIKELKYVDTKSLTLTVIGPIEDAVYWEGCIQMFKGLPEEFKLNYLGSLDHGEVLKKLNQSHFFVLPSTSENYGHAIIEALTMACPVLISDQTPWLGLKERNLGSDISLTDNDMWRSETQRLVDMNDEQYQLTSISCAEFAKEKLQDQSIINKNRSLFGE
jgi:glycosyltransferase involved in cell wall biosynthesis